MKLVVKDLGLTNYPDVYNSMRSFTQNRDFNTPDQLWFCEHREVFTLGKKANKNNIIIPNDVPTIETDRGGEITFHGPGQLVIYPLINIKRIKIFPKEFINLLENILQNTFSFFGIETVLIKDIHGVFIPRENNSIGIFKNLNKVSSIGLKISNSSSYHGISININTNLDYFKMINPCGYEGLKNINLIEFNKNISIDKVKNKFLENFKLLMTKDGKNFYD